MLHRGRNISASDAAALLRRRGNVVKATRKATALATLVVALGLPVAADEDRQITPELVFSSTVGEVVFPHKAHFNDMEIACESCHHETNARMLDIPHREYFADFWIDCTTCHHPSEEPQKAMSCSACHHCPVQCTDETLSSKVVIHASCWGCHEIGAGAEASASCVSCHSGPKRAWRDDKDKERLWTADGS